MENSAITSCIHDFEFLIVYKHFVDKTKYMVMSREQTAGLSHTMKVDNSSIESVEEFKYLGTRLTNQPQK